LVEPVAAQFAQPPAFYRGLPQARFENVTIAESDGQREFFWIAVDPIPRVQADWLTQVGSLPETG
jgi:hypothetical protein